jgi:hypothetical protein
LSAVASLALAQGKPTAAAPRDAGVSLVRPVAVDGGVQLVTSPGPAPEVEKLRKELNDLKLRTAELERQQQAKADALTADLEKLGKKVEDLKVQLKVLSDAEERRADAEEAVVTRKTQTTAGAASVNAVLVQLVSGNTNNIEPSLRYAESVFTGPAQRDVQLARAALVQGDLAAARQYLVLALIEVEAQR